MSRTFTVPITGDADALVKKAQAVAQSNGATFTGDANAGQFSGSGVAGHYQRTGNQLTITIDKKPFIMPWAMVESQIKGFFA